MTHRLIAYFRDCLLADGGERQITDVFGKEEREQHLFAFSPGQWDPAAPIMLPSGYAERVISLLKSQRQERQLLLGAYLVTGPVAEQREHAGYVRAPLLLFNAEFVERNGEYAVRPQPASAHVNLVVLETLGLSTSVDGLDVVNAHGWLEPFTRLSHVATPSELPRWRAGEAPYWIASGVVWVTPRSQAVHGIAQELKAMGAPEGKLSQPLRRILGVATQAAKSGAAPLPETLPTRLTEPQERTLRNAAAETLSAVSGPPGSGKTFVIACQAIDRMLREERVLIVCSNERAADVAHDKLSGLLGPAEGLVVRAKHRDYRRHLVERLDALLAQPADLDFGEKTGQIEKTLRAMAQDYRRHERGFQWALDQAAVEGQRIHREQTGGLEALRGWWTRRHLHKKPLLSERWSSLQKDVAEHQRFAQEYLIAVCRSRLRRLLKEMRPQLAALVSALRSSNSSHREERSKSADWDLLTRAFPVWVVSAQELSRVVPLQQDLFDLVILDDANQCSLPLALPALQRAPRAVVVGDPKQLRHLSSLSRERQRHLALKHGVENVTLDLDYRERSLLDYALNAAAGSQSIVVLDDHFRSHPALFDFINQRFYGGRVKVLTHHKENPGQPPVELAECPVQVVADVNMGEVDAVAQRLKAFIEESRELPDNDCPTIGVMAFFPATALRLKHELLKQFEPHILRRHHFMVGTPLAFQGDERDIMLIATSVYPGRADAAWSHINRPDLFNLAVTRARHRQIMFIPKGALGSVAPSLLADYLVHVKQAQARSTVPKDLPPDSMRSELISTLESWGARCRTDYPFAGQTLDMVALYGDHVLAIDTVGTLSAVGTAWDWERYRLLSRAGLSVFPISYLDWEERRDQVLEELRKAFGGAEMGLELQGIQHFRALRWRLEELREPEPLGLLDALERAYRQSVRWLQLRFQPTELTYDRYHQSIEGLQQAAFTELDGATRLLEGLRDLTPEAGIQVRRDVQARLEECGRANAALNALAERLALLRTSDSGLQGAMAEVNRLAERVSRYDASSKREAGD